MSRPFKWQKDDGEKKIRWVYSILSTYTYKISYFHCVFLLIYVLCDVCYYMCNFLYLQEFKVWWFFLKETSLKMLLL